MIPVFLNYATPSAFTSERDRALLGMAANARRPVRFHGRVVKHTMLLRFALRSLGEAIWSNDTWLSDADIISLLDPVITVHPDRIFFEAFSQDQSAYAMLILDPALFETDGDVRTGTTNVDFTAWLWAALAEMRSSRETWLRIDPGGFDVATHGAGGRFEQKVDLPDDWVRGFLQLQGAMAMPGTRLTVRPVNLLSAIRFLRYTKAKVSPRGLRYEFTPGEDARLVLEPWEHVVPLRGAEHSYVEPRTIRTWGRRRLKLIEPLLPFADSVDIYLKGRALPSFYAVKMPGMTFVLGLSGWTGHRWTETGSFDLLSDPRGADEAVSAQVGELLRTRFAAGVNELAEATGQPRNMVSRALEKLCRQGRAIFDVETRGFRSRELFEEPIDEAKLYPPDPRRERAEKMRETKAVRIASCEPQENRKARRLKTPEGPQVREIVYREWHVEGAAGEEESVSIVVNDLARIIFGTCGCAFFRDNLLNKGPCEHMIALFAASEDRRRDLPTSTASPEAALRSASANEEADKDENEDDETIDEDDETEDDDRK